MRHHVKPSKNNLITNTELSKTLYTFVNNIIRDIKDIGGYPKDYTFIILGKPAPTGKTYLCELLRSQGYNAFEISEEVLPYVEYCDNKNHYSIAGVHRQVTIILNQQLHDLNQKKIY